MKSNILIIRKDYNNLYMRVILALCSTSACIGP